MAHQVNKFSHKSIGETLEVMFTSGKGEFLIYFEVRSGQRLEVSSIHVP